VFPVLQQGGPASRAGVSAAGSVGIDRDRFQAWGAFLETKKANPANLRRAEVSI
jgi:hypothetical protein